MSEPGDAPERWTRWQPLPLATPAGTPARLTPQPAPAARGAQAAQADEASEDAQLALEEAKAEQQARENLFEQAREQGFQTGFQTGLAEGRLKGEKEGFESGQRDGLKDSAAKLKAQSRQLAGLMQSCSQAIHGLEAEMGQALIALAVRIAEHILHSTLESHPEKIQALVGDILQMENTQGLVQLRLHPEDLALIEGSLPEDSAHTQWQLVADESITRGGCQVRTALGDIDATLETRWRRLAASLGV